MSRVAVDGFCPACARQALALKVFGVRGPTPQVLCMNPECTQPNVVALLLRDAETEHRVMIGSDGEWTLKHPLRERAADDLFSCDFHEHLRCDYANGNWPDCEGLYRVVYVGHDPMSSYLHAPMLAWEAL